MDQAGVNALAVRREKLASARRNGVEGLVTNPRLLMVALVAALGGLNYGYECVCFMFAARVFLISF